MKRTNVTYGQLDRVLRSLNFSCRLVTLSVPTCVYEHEQSGAIIMLPPFPETESALDYHLVAVQTTLDNFGVADATAFASELQKAG